MSCVIIEIGRESETLDHSVVNERSWMKEVRWGYIVYFKVYEVEINCEKGALEGDLLVRETFLVVNNGRVLFRNR